MTQPQDALRKVTAIVRPDRVEDIEKALRRAGVPGMTVDEVKGYGEYPDVITFDWLARHARIETVVNESDVPRIVDIIVDAGYAGMPGDGIIYVEPVVELYRIRDRGMLKSA